MTGHNRTRSLAMRRIVALALASTLLTLRQARSDGLDVDVIETAPTLTVVPPPSAACAPGSTPPPGNAGAQAALSSRSQPLSEPPPASALAGSDAEGPEASEPPLAVLLSLDEPRAAFALAEEAAFHLEEALAALERSRAAHAFAFVDYEPLLDRIRYLTDSVRRTFRPDLNPPHSVAPPARPVSVDGEFWRIGAPEP